MRLLPVGHRALLVDELDDPAAWALALRGREQPGVIEIVPAARTVLIECASDGAAAAVRELAAALRVEQGPVASGARSIEVEVRYDGDDLESVAEVVGIGVDELVELHTATTYRVAFCGFAPGFAYLIGADRRLHLPRRDTPRTSVPAGSVAVAAGYTAIYPRATPGGWHLLGTTDAVIFDPHRARPALLEPGMLVRLVPS